METKIARTPSQTRSYILRVRITPQTADTLQEMADRRRIPISTFVDRILARITYNETRRKEKKAHEIPKTC